MTTIYHIVQRDSWEAACAQGRYEPESLRTQGFIHCSTTEQVAPVANALFRGQTGLGVSQPYPPKSDTRQRGS